ncbi:inositol monophosphatase family protein [Streptomyces sp. NPDC090045]|uniref:inositol monophosphatase family protein n=1 Tax=Streptomyces sp. NPDC090045 TaxID=3365927 RepID=UPI0038039261
MKEFQELLPQVVKAVREVGAFVAARHTGSALGGLDVDGVIAVFRMVDAPASELLRERLSALRPQARWAPDEIGTAVASTGEQWVCDAVDGAVHFLQGLPYWGVTVTLVADGRPVLAVLDAPHLGFLYTAVEGGGAHLNGRLLSTSGKSLAAALACTSQPPYNREPEKAGASLTAMLRHTLAVRNLGPTALQVAQVGSGHVDVFWEYGEDANNLLSGALIARESGALVTDAEGKAWTPASTSFVAAPAALHADVLRVLAAAPVHNAA